MAYTDRTADYVISKAWAAAKMKSTVPTGSKYDALIIQLDSEQKDYENEEGVEWDSFYELVNTGTISATDTYDLDDSIRFVSKRENDYVYTTDGTQKKTYKLVKPNQLYQYKDSDAIAQVGRTLVFSRTPDSTFSDFGYSIMVPAYVYADDITASTSIVRCDNVMYLVYMLTAFICSQDLTKNYLEDRFVQKAQTLMNKMKQDASGQNEEVTRTAFLSAGGETWI